MEQNSQSNLFLLWVVVDQLWVVVSHLRVVVDQLRVVVSQLGVVFSFSFASLLFFSFFDCRNPT